MVLSHIVNGLISAKSSAFPDSPEVEGGKVCKLRSDSYITTGQTYYLAHVLFGHDLFTKEARRTNNARQDPDLPSEEWSDVLQDLWRSIPADNNDHFDSTFPQPGPFADEDLMQKVRDALSAGCTLYFPSDRFEDPAWLNEEDLKVHVRRVHISQLTGRTNRKIIATSPLHENCDWLFDVTYDVLVSENELRRLQEQVAQGNATNPMLRERMAYHMQVTASWNTALNVLREIIGKSDATFAVGNRRSRTLSVHAGGEQYVSSVFQLSSGECALLNLFLSILRDADLSGAAVSGPGELQGIVLVDEIDLHLHVAHQRRVLPKLIRMFPKVQFIVTSHSPLFLLGMRETFGETGFETYQLP